MTRTLNRTLFVILGLLLLLGLWLLLTTAAGGQFKGKMKGKDKDSIADMQTFHYLLEHRAEIQRKVTNREDGVETLTESARPAITARIQEHVDAMHRRLKEGRGIHLRDPLFAEIFRHREQIQMKLEKTDKGMLVRETSTDPYVVQLIQAHAEVVSGFLKLGHAEMMKNHPLPERKK